VCQRIPARSGPRKGGIPDGRLKARLKRRQDHSCLPGAGPHVHLRRPGCPQDADAMQQAASFNTGVSPAQTLDRRRTQDRETMTASLKLPGHIPVGAPAAGTGVRGACVSGDAKGPVLPPVLFASFNQTLDEFGYRQVDVGWEGCTRPGRLADNRHLRCVPGESEERPWTLQSGRSPAGSRQPGTAPTRPCPPLICSRGQQPDHDWRGACANCGARPVLSPPLCRLEV
jgi:hypothetical protein